MSLKKRVASLALLFLFVLVGVFAFHVSLRAYAMNPCCDLYVEEVLIGKGDLHHGTGGTWCDCIRIYGAEDEYPCNPYCVYYHIS